MKILRVKRLPLFDVFTGEGWLNWTRIVKNDNGNLKVISGNQLNATEKFAVQEYVTNLERKDNA